MPLIIKFKGSAKYPVKESFLNKFNDKTCKHIN